MRPTSEKERVKVEDENGTSLVLDPGIRNKLLSEEEAEVWLEFAGDAVQGLTSNPDLTANNAPTTISDEACLMADRMLINYRFRIGGVEAKTRKSSRSNNNQK